MKFRFSFSIFIRDFGFLFIPPKGLYSTIALFFQFLYPESYQATHISHFCKYHMMHFIIMKEMFVYCGTFEKYRKEEKCKPPIFPPLRNK